MYDVGFNSKSSFNTLKNYRIQETIKTTFGFRFRKVKLNKMRFTFSEISRLRAFRSVNFGKRQNMKNKMLLPPRCLYLRCFAIMPLAAP